MNILHLTPADYKTSAWSGGTTTELFIYPAGASYAAREFRFRISSAVVELAQSDFTQLAGVERFITPLSGCFTLTHPGKAPVVLGPLAAPYRFSGEAPTHCVGKATDFNLMLKGCQGEMSVCTGCAPVKPGFNSFYATESAVFILGGERYSMAKGDTLVVFSEEASGIDLGAANIIVCWVKL